MNTNNVRRSKVVLTGLLVLLPLLLIGELYLPHTITDSAFWAVAWVVLTMLAGYWLMGIFGRKQQQ